MIKFLVTLLLLAGFGLAGSLLFSSSLYRMAEQEFLGLGDPDEAIARLEVARRVDPSHPRVLAMLARFQTIDQAVESYRTLIALNPNDPLAWAHLFETKLALQQPDEEALLALKRAGELGPFEPRVLEVVISAGSLHWLKLDAQFRRSVVAASVRVVQGGFYYRKGEMIAQMRQTGLLRLACGSPSLDGHASCLSFQQS